MIYFSLLVLCLLLVKSTNGTGDKPNIVFIMADDMGVGDVSYNSGKAMTPNIDRLAKEGMKFTDVHTTSSVCTPSRYGLLTGRYNWRTRLQRRVFFEPLEKPLIAEGEETIANMLRENGYNTACIGKWHLGIQWQLRNHTNPSKNMGPAERNTWRIDYRKPALITPTSHGFDYFHGIAASLDIPPYVYIENQTALGNVAVTKAFMRRKGAAAIDFDAVDCLKHWADKSRQYIESMSRSEKPFFLYLPLTSPHTPILPSKQWVNASKIGSYGDFIMETDWVVGSVLATLDRLKIADNTMVVFTTDNGAAPVGQSSLLPQAGHHPSGHYRGHKGDIYEGGHRVPTVIRWPNKIRSGTTSNRTIILADFFATYSEMLGIAVKKSSAVDSVSFYGELVGLTCENRSAIVMHDFEGRFAIRDNNMKLAFTKETNRLNKAAGLQKWQLYDLLEDPHERKNIYRDHPLLVDELYTLMLKYIEMGRSTDGAMQQNDVHIHLLKDETTNSATSKTNANTPRVSMLRRKSSANLFQNALVGSLMKPKETAPSPTQ